jgi:poly-gamma-glutamate system protein
MGVVRKPQFLNNVILIGCALSGVLIVLLAGHLLAPSPLPWYEEMKEASLLMEDCSRVIRERREALGYTLERRNDPNGTGLIGEDITAITTTTGNLEAKRSAASPDFAALMVRLYREAGLENGDTIALGASGSFPGAFIASLCAARVMKLRVIAALSLGASNWGANIPDLTILDMYRSLAQRLPVEAALVSLGGIEDTGKDLGLGLIEGGREGMIQKIYDSGLPYILETDFTASVEKRLEFYADHAEPEGQAGIAVFVNIGGADVNIGLGVWSLQLQPGINTPGKAGPASGLSPADGGCTASFLNAGIPVIHILNIKNLALSYGLAFDPVPLPEAGKEDLYFHSDPARQKFVFLALTVFYLLVCAGAIKSLFNNRQFNQSA